MKPTVNRLPFLGGCSVRPVRADSMGMPWVGSIIPTRAAGLDDKAQRLRRERDEKRRIVTGDSGFARALDEAELASVEATEAVEHALAPEPAESEEGREDREKHGFNDPRGSNLDIQG